MTSKIWVYYLEYKEDILNTHVSYVCWIAELTMNTINVEYAQIKREILTPGSHNILYEPLVDRKESFNATIAYQMRYGKTLYEITKGRWSNFCLLREIFPKHTAAKMFSSCDIAQARLGTIIQIQMGGIFTGPKIRKMIQSVGTLRNQCQSHRKVSEIHFGQLLTVFWATGNMIDILYLVWPLLQSKKWQKREFPISQKIFSSQKNENNSDDQCALENNNQQKNCECQLVT